MPEAFRTPLVCEPDCAELFAGLAYHSRLGSEEARCSEPSPSPCVRRDTSKQAFWYVFISFDGFRIALRSKLSVCRWWLLQTGSRRLLPLKAARPPRQLPRPFVP